MPLEFTQKELGLHRFPTTYSILSTAAVYKSRSHIPTRYDHRASAEFLCYLYGQL